MQESNQTPSFSFFHKMFDFIVNDLRSRFFKGQMTDQAFIVGMKIISEISVKAYNLPDQNTMSIRHVEMLMLEAAYLGMKADILSLVPQNEADELMLQSTVENYDKGFTLWQQCITIVD